MSSKAQLLAERLGLVGLVQHDAGVLVDVVEHHHRGCRREGAGLGDDEHGHIRDDGAPQRLRVNFHRLDGQAERGAGLLQERGDGVGAGGGQVVIGGPLGERDGGVLGVTVAAT